MNSRRNSNLGMMQASCQITKRLCSVRYGVISEKDRLSFVFYSFVIAFLPLQKVEG